MHGEGHVWQEGMHGSGCVVRGHAWQGDMRAGETATEAGGTHPAGMHSCRKTFCHLSRHRELFLVKYSSSLFIS